MKELKAKIADLFIARERVQAQLGQLNGLLQSSLDELAALEKAEADKKDCPPLPEGEKEES